MTAETMSPLVSMRPPLTAGAAKTRVKALHTASLTQARRLLSHALSTTATNSSAVMSRGGQRNTGRAANIGGGNARERSSSPAGSGGDDCVVVEKVAAGVPPQSSPPPMASSAAGATPALRDPSSATSAARSSPVKAATTVEVQGASGGNDASAKEGTNEKRPASAEVTVLDLCSDETAREKRIGCGSLSSSASPTKKLKLVRTWRFLFCC